MLRAKIFVIFAIFASVFSFAHAQSSSTAASQSNQQIDLDGTKQWIDTNIDLRANEKLSFTATGTVTYPPSASSKSQDSQTFGPDGLARSFRDLLHQYPVADGGHGALIGRLGSGDVAQPFLIGASKEFT